MSSQYPNALPTPATDSASNAVVQPPTNVNPPSSTGVSSAGTTPPIQPTLKGMSPCLYLFLPLNKCFQ